MREKRSWFPTSSRIAFLHRFVLTALILIGLLFSTFSLASAEPGKSDVSVQATPPIRFAPVTAPVHPNRPGQGATTTSVVYPPSKIQSAYNFGSLANGANQTIAIIDAYGDPTLTSDLATFDSQFGLPAATVNVIQVDGTPGKNSNWALETALDVEWAHANAPGATIYLIVVPDASFQHLLDGVNAAVSISPAVNAISMSWGASESTFVQSGYKDPYENAFQKAAANGTVLLASSGDSGAYNGSRPRKLTLNYPASSPQVVSVGGTTLTQNSSTLAWGEKAWSSSGGGYSSIFSEPSYQSAAKINDPSGMRGSPDVSFDADPNTGVYVYSSGTWYAVGGTSVGAPNWAAIVADYAAAKGSNGLNLSFIYGAYTTNYASDFRDVTSGNNGYYNAGTGWDATTGVGSPNVTNLLN